MKFFSPTIFALLLIATAAKAEITEANSGALSVFGIGCEELKAEEPKTTTRLKATDKACFSAISTLPEITNIKESFDEHDFNVMIYDIVDEYIEDLTVKTTQQDKDLMCVEISGYVAAENIGNAIDKALKDYEQNEIVEKQTQIVVPTMQMADPSSQATIVETEIKTTTPQTQTSYELLQLPEMQQDTTEDHIIILSTIFVRPTEFYNHTYSNNHSGILKNILSQSERIQIVDNENEANFVVTPKVLKAKIEQLNKETSRMQMVVALEVFDRNNNTTQTQHQNKFALFSNTDNEQAVAKTLLSQMFEQGGFEIIHTAEKSSKEIYKNQQKMPEHLPEVITSMPQVY